MTTRTRASPPGYDPSEFPGVRRHGGRRHPDHGRGRLHVLLVRRGEEPFEGMWAIPGGFKRPDETLDEAARRELSEETGVDVPSLLTQFGAYGDPGRDPRMNVVTVGYLAVLRDVGAIVAGTDAAHAALIPVSDMLDGEDRAGVRPPADRPRRGRARPRRARGLGHRDRLRRPDVHAGRAAGGVRGDLGRAARRRELPAQLVAEDGWVIPTGRRRDPGPAGGRPAELYRAGRAWKHGGPIHRFQRTERGSERMRAVVHDRYGPPEVLRIADVERPVPKDDEVLVRVHASTVTRGDAMGVRSAEPFTSVSSPASAARGGRATARSSPAGSRRSARP